jgi:hypothetical protein
VIAKIVTGDDFAAALRYASRKGPLLATNIVSPFGSSEAGPLASEMQLYAGCRYDVKKPVLHVAIRLPVQDAMRLIDADFLTIARLFMTGMGIDRNRHQYVVYKHDPDHVHLIVNRVDADRKVWNDKFSHYRAINACRQIEQRCNLTPVTSEPNMTRILLTRGELAMEAKTGKPSPKRVIYETVDAVVPRCSSIDDMEALLAEKGISMFVDPGRGVSYVYDGIAFQGRRISRSCTLNNIRKRIAGQPIEPPRVAETGSVVALPPMAPRRYPVMGIASLKTPRDTRELRSRPSRSRRLMGTSLES